MKPITNKSISSLTALCAIGMLVMSTSCGSSSASSSSNIPQTGAAPVISGDTSPVIGNSGSSGNIQAAGSNSSDPGDTPNTSSKSGSIADTPPASGISDSFGSTASADANIFSTRSFWYAKIPAGVQLHVNSDNYVTEFLRQLTTYYGTVTINTNKFSAPVYVADASTPTVSVTEWDCQSKGYSDAKLAKQWSAVPVPAAALPSNDSDAEMVIYQPSSDTLWEFWKARKVNGNWQGCWGGRMQKVSQGIGNWKGHYGADATGLPLMGGMITPEELQSGTINHVIGIALVDLETFGIFSWPAVRSDGWNPTNEANRIPAGSRFRLDPTINVDILNMTPVGKMIAKAAQTYGFIVWDKSGAISLRAKDPKSYTQLGQPDPYPSLYSNVPTYAILNNFPWKSLQFLPMDYGKVGNQFAPPVLRLINGDE